MSGPVSVDGESMFFWCLEHYSLLIRLPQFDSCLFRANGQSQSQSKLCAPVQKLMRAALFILRIKLSWSSALWTHFRGSTSGLVVTATVAYLKGHWGHWLSVELWVEPVKSSKCQEREFVLIKLIVSYSSHTVSWFRMPLTSTVFSIEWL